MGTHFNVNSYANEGAIKIILPEGSVKIQSSAGSKVLVPGQQAAVSEHQIKITPADTEAAIAWENGFCLYSMKQMYLPSYGKSPDGTMRRVIQW